jgi:exopolysaccharide biosynthesis protein
LLINEADANGNFLFKSRTPMPPEDPNAMTFADGVHNATRILPGELYHAANPNPRSALVITMEGLVVMVKVEGRDNRGVGMDLSQLAEFCRVFLHARHAINLDGGNSSQITWKLPNQDFINITGGAEATKSYLVGSIISLVKD